MSYLRESSGSYVTGCLFLMACLLAASGVITWIRREIRRVEGVRVYEKVGDETAERRERLTGGMGNGMGVEVDSWQEQGGKRGGSGEEAEDEEEKVARGVGVGDRAVGGGSPVSALVAEPVITATAVDGPEEEKKG